MSVSNYLCKEEEAERFVQCLVPVFHGVPGQQHVVFVGKGFIPQVFKDAVNKARAGYSGVTKEQIEAYDNFKKLLKDINKNVDTYKRTGVLITMAEKLIHWAEKYVNGDSVANGGPVVYTTVAPLPGAIPPAYNPYAVPQAVPTAPLPPPQYPPPSYPPQYPQYPPPPYPPPAYPPPTGPRSPMPNLVLHVPHCGLTRACP
jgi:hypothetical protein